MWIVGNEIVRTRVDVSEITSTPAGDSDFLAYTFSELDNKDSPASFPASIAQSKPAAPPPIMITSGFVEFASCQLPNVDWMF